MSTHAARGAPASAPSRLVGGWLLGLAALVCGQVLLGGVTRLTGSGLSITEWRPVTGAVPPLTAAEWDEAFAKYRRIPQFERVNPHFDLADFKRIYFWEWLHRLWARLLGLCFLAPLPWLWRRGLLRGRRRALGTLLLLGAAQALLGWLMVVSGLTERPYVSHLRLAAHLTAALGLLGLLLWLALRELAPLPERRFAPAPWVLLGLVTAQVIYGAFMAGLHAAGAAPSWPDLNGVFLPRAAFESFDDLLTVHFVHRNLAYLIAALVVVHWRFGPAAAPGGLRHAPPLVVLLQIALGAATVLHAGAASYLGLALAHQLGAVALFAALLALAYFSRAEPARAAAPLQPSAAAPNGASS